jgi:1-deoxy-D-xylulose-5-phosphate synthase
VGITPAMREGSGMVEFERRFPTRSHDVGIAEQHAVTFAAGLACEGLKPVLAIYSTFLQRGYDQVIHDVALQNLPVVFAIDRAGLVGADGATHAGAYDIAYLRCIPNLAVLTPSDENECRLALNTAFAQQQPVAVRYPRGAGVGVAVQKDLSLTLPWGQGDVRRESRLPAQGSQPRIALLAFGTLLHPALAAAEKLDATVANMRFVKDSCLMGGAGSAVLEALQAAGISMPVLTLGLPDEFIEHGDVAKLHAGVGLDAAGIERSVLKRFAAPPSLVRPAASA